MTKDLSQMTIFATVERAQYIADLNTRDDGEWTYEVNTCLEGAYIEVYDETGAFLGYL